MRRLSALFKPVCVYPSLLLISVGGCASGSSASGPPAAGLERAPLYRELPAHEIEPAAGTCVVIDDHVYPAQVERIDGERVRVWWLGPADARATASIRSDASCPGADWTWQHPRNDGSVLLRNGRATLGYEHPVFDPDAIEETKKPFHHVFAPDGRRTITKGLGGLYPHHRGIYLGYNVISIEGDTAALDVWHANHGERTEHIRVLEEYAGAVMGGHRTEILWKDRGGRPFIEEVRDVRVFELPGDELLIDFVSTLRTLGGAIVLGGDRHHAGVQFRAAQEVADNREGTRFLRPAGLADFPEDEELGGTDHVDLGWNAMRFSLDGRRYTVAYLSHPSNPRGAEMSERKYGRFGEFIPYRLTEEEPLTLRYRFWISADRPVTREDVEHHYARFADSFQSPMTR